MGVITPEMREKAAAARKAKAAARPPLGQAVDMSAMAAIVQQAVEAATKPLQEQITALQEERERLLPSFKPMERNDLHNVGRRQAAYANAVKGQATGGTAGVIPVDAHGRVIPTGYMAHLPARFPDGATVRIRRDSVREGSDRPWGTILDEIGCEGIGTIRHTVRLAKPGVWKYRVAVPGLTEGRSGDGFYHDELEFLAAA